MRRRPEAIYTDRSRLASCRAKRAPLRAFVEGGTPDISRYPKQSTNLELVELGDMASKTAALLGQGLP